ncbi:MAG: hypothetical protein QOH39_3179 [Verrucomicrobiota bacterium]
MSEFFTQSREGAKKKSKPKHRRFVGLTTGAANPLLTLGALASLRETSGSTHKKESFTLRK